MVTEWSCLLRLCFQMQGLGDHPRKGIYLMFLRLSTYPFDCQSQECFSSSTKMLHFSEYYLSVTGFSLTSSIFSSLTFLMMTFR